MEPNANDHPSSPIWRSSDPTDLSMYREGESLGTVWRDPDRNTWGAMVNVGSRQLAEYDFLSMKEAQLWCEEYIQQLQREEGEAAT